MYRKPIEFKIKGWKKKTLEEKESFVEDIIRQMMCDFKFTKVKKEEQRNGFIWTIQR